MNDNMIRTLVKSPLDASYIGMSKEPYMVTPTLW